MLAWIIARSASANPEVTAAALLAEFGSLAAVLAAEPSRLRTAVGEDRDALPAIDAFRSVMRHALEENVHARPILGNSPALLNHLRSQMAFDPSEQFRVLHLDTRYGLIVEDVVSGTVDTAPVYIREVIRRALEVGAATLVFAHNHPSGNPIPSAADIALTRSLVHAAQLFGIRVHDHLIITVREHTSMRAEGLIQ